jgi:hypothetical protein
MGRVGELNIRVLERMTGREKWNNITLVTTKWNCSDRPAEERAREIELEEDDAFWKSMREGEYKARMARFMNNKDSALEIIKWHLSKDFCHRYGHVTPSRVAWADAQWRQGWRSLSMKLRVLRVIRP